MSELKAKRAFFSEDEYERGEHKICAKVSDCGYDRKNDWWSYAFEDEVYLKSEADKVIADLEESHKMEVEQLLMEIVGLKDSVDYNFEQFYNERKLLLHYKYRRCLDEVKICQLSIERYGRYIAEFKDCGYPSIQRWRFLKNHYEKWYQRWLQLAEKIKEVK